MKNNEIYIIGGGSSLTDFDFSKLENKTTITVNKGLAYVPNLNYFVTMDFTALRKIPAIEGSNATKIFIANLAEPCLQEMNGQIIDVRFNLIYKLEDFDMIIKSRNKNGIGFSFNDFRNGENSGFCALQLAILLGYKNIYLLGIDLDTVKESTHFHHGYNQNIKKFKQNLEAYYKNFVIGIKELKIKKPEIKVISCSQISKLNRVIPYEKFK